MTLPTVIGPNRVIFIRAGVTTNGVILRSRHQEEAAKCPARR